MNALHIRPLMVTVRNAGQVFVFYTLSVKGARLDALYWLVLHFLFQFCVSPAVDFEADLVGVVVILFSFLGFLHHQARLLLISNQG